MAGVDISQIALFLVIGLLGGVWNAVAGGATLFTFPALVAVGLPPMVANATNFLALLPSNAAALPAYRHELFAIGWRLAPLVVVSGFGAVLGSLLLLASDPAIFMALVPTLILVATGLFAFGDALRVRFLDPLDARTGAIAVYAALFVFSIYGGYFGAGLGIVLLGVAKVLGFAQFHDANAVKNLLATSFVAVSVAVFGIGGLIDWHAAGVVMIGSAIGGYFGAIYARHVRESVLRLAVIVFGCVLAAVFALRGVA